MKHILFAFGWAFFIVGLIGVFLPILPTTPFLLLAAGCFSKSSDKFYQWLMNMPHMGERLHDWRQHRVIGFKAKIFASVLILAAICYVAFFVHVSIWVKVIMALTCLGVLTFIWIQKSKKK